MKRFLILGMVFIALFLFHRSSFSSSSDFGERDTVRFGNPCGYISGSPGKIAIPVIFWSDSYIASFGISLKWTGPIQLDTAYLVVFGDSTGSITVVEIDTANSRVCLAWINWYNYLPPGNGPRLSLCFSVTDTGLATIDTTTWGGYYCEFSFSDPGAYSWTPHFSKGEFDLTVIATGDKMPGDVDFDRDIDLADVILLANYYFKGAEHSTCLPCTDVNCDCEINLSDVIYLANYYLKGGPAPRLGCAW